MKTQTWSIERTAQSWVGVGFLVILLVVDGLLIHRWLSVSWGVAAVALGVAVALAILMTVALALRLHACLTLRFILDERTLTIVRGTARWVIPLATIQTIKRGEARAVFVEGLWLPGFSVGQGYIKDEGRALFFTTRSAAASVAIKAMTCTYVLSPKHGDDFVTALEAHRQEAGPAQAAEPGAGVLSVLRQPLPAFFVVLAGILNAALYAYVAWWYPVLPDQMPVHFTAVGVPDQWNAPSALFWLPQIGTIILVVNCLLAVMPPLRRPLTVSVLLAAAVIVQIFLWIAFQRLLP